MKNKFATHLLVAVKGIVNSLIVGAGYMGLNALLPGKPALMVLYGLFGIWFWGYLGYSLWKWN